MIIGHPDEALELSHGHGDLAYISVRRGIAMARRADDVFST